jgi:hypothetical protein
MKTLVNGRTLIEKIMKKNGFKWTGERPLIAVLRNTKQNDDGSFEYVRDDSTNCCDTVLLIDRKRRDAISLTGRSFPHREYQARQVAHTENANYIASGFYPMAWRKGFHFKYRALVQHVKFMIWRSEDMELGEGDDRPQYGVVWDDFHGWAPDSAGCVTVKGTMQKEDGDWGVAVKWIYNTNDPYTFFDAAILNNSDINDEEEKLRFGSGGSDVKKMQRLLSKIYGIKIDGDFGPVTHNALIKFQRENGLMPDGIYGPKTRAALEEKGK